MAVLFKTNDGLVTYKRTDYLVYDIIDKYKRDKLQEYPNKTLQRLHEELHNALVNAVILLEEEGVEVIPTSHDFREALTLIGIILSKRGVIV